MPKLRLVLFRESDGSVSLRAGLGAVVGCLMPAKKRSALDALRARYVGDDPPRQAELQAARDSAEVARQIRDLRVAAGMTQRQLAGLVGTSHTAISRLENDDYAGHSLTMLRRIAAALGRRVEVRFVPIRRARRA